MPADCLSGGFQGRGTLPLSPYPQHIRPGVPQAQGTNHWLLCPGLGTVARSALALSFPHRIKLYFPTVAIDLEIPYVEAFPFSPYQSSADILVSHITHVLWNLDLEFAMVCKGGGSPNQENADISFTLGMEDPRQYGTVVI